MIRNFETIEDLNIFYAQSLSELATVSNNVNDEILQSMVNELMKDYKLNLDLLNMNYRFQCRLHKRKKRFEHRQKRLDFNFELSKLKAKYWRKWLDCRRMLKVFKKQCKVVSDTEIKKEELKLTDMLKVSERPLIEDAT